MVTSQKGSLTGNSSGGYYGYRASKSALNMFSKSLSVDLKERGISVLLLHPGYVKTDMTHHKGDIEVNESVKGMIKIVEEKGLESTGTFWHTDGDSLSW
jgi:NAD(P)-dependent dehydrogenase (short-subunit alcohol dehydrogenase family)